MPNIIGQEIGPIGYGLLGKSITLLNLRRRPLIFS